MATFTWAGQSNLSGLWVRRESALLGSEAWSEARSMRNLPLCILFRQSGSKRKSGVCLLTQSRRRIGTLRRNAQNRNGGCAKSRVHEPVAQLAPGCSVGPVVQLARTGLRWGQGESISSKSGQNGVAPSAQSGEPPHRGDRSMTGRRGSLDGKGRFVAPLCSMSRLSRLRQLLNCRRKTLLRT